MRKIKFRAWDSKDKKMVILEDSWSNHECDCHCGLAGYVFSPLAIALRHPDRHIVMQYTGLKDSKNREIYEGDIIDTHFSKEFKPRYRPIVFRNGAFLLDPNPDGILRMVQEPEDFEVIGNVYENPELLSSHT